MLTYTDLDIPTYQTHRENAFVHFLLDVREPFEHTLRRIPGAVNIPLNDLPERLDEVPTDQPVVVVCEHGVRSVYAASFLARTGHEGIYNLVGGTAEWELRGLEMER